MARQATERIAPARIPPALRSSPDVRKRMSGPAMRTFLNIAGKWDISAKEQVALLGWPSASAFYNYKKGDVPALPHDMLTRISIVLGIFKALHILFPDEGLANRWVKLPNSNLVFGGKTPIDFMADAGIDGMYKVRRLLDARRGGWN